MRRTLPLLLVSLFLLVTAEAATVKIVKNRPGALPDAGKPKGKSNNNKKNNLKKTNNKKQNKKNDKPKKPKVVKGNTTGRLARKSVNSIYITKGFANVGAAPTPIPGAPSSGPAKGTGVPLIEILVDAKTKVTLSGQTASHTKLMPGHYLTIAYEIREGSSKKYATSIKATNSKSKAKKPASKKPAAKKKK